MKKYLMLYTGILFMSASIANAAFITTNNISNPTVVDFSTQPTVVGASGPLQIGQLVGADITVSGTPSASLWTNYNEWPFGTNGTWGNGKTYIANNVGNSSLLFSFNDGPVSAVSAFINYHPGFGDLIISAYNTNMILLESYNVTTLADIVTPNGVNAGAIRGINRGVNDIKYFEVSSIYPVLDDLTYTHVPEPTTLLLASLGAALFSQKRRRRNL
ncbi:MAG: PEP-CTERM sorting domain-containing protein [Phycisphaerae bacterium]|nr:PEP-CTERM sorting domain-containing protein [Phycisphaerae bacterium]